jgi:apolipoprotein D and lipocalin family protein
MRTLFLCYLVGLAVNAEKIPELASFPYVNLERYSGLWHEIARLPNSCETHCVESTLEYHLTSDGSVDVTHHCTKSNGYKRSAQGFMKIKNAPHNSRLATNFVPKWLRWTGLGWSDYWVIDLDPNYKYAVVSEPDREYLWILSRTPTLERSTYDGLIKKLEDLHFNLSHLIVSNAQNSKQPEREASLFR